MKDYVTRIREALDRPEVARVKRNVKHAVNRVIRVVSPKDPELVEKTLYRLEQQDVWNDVFSTKLIELLDKSDASRAEIKKATASYNEALKRLELFARRIKVAVGFCSVAVSVCIALAILALWLPFRASVTVWMPAALLIAAVAAIAYVARGVRNAS